MSEKTDHPSHLVKTMRVLKRTRWAQYRRRKAHSKKVAELAEAVAVSMRLPEAEVASIRRAALLQDLGNLSVSEEVLLKPGPLTEEEFQQVRGHVELSARNLEAVEELQDVAPIVRHHHERVDGSGYPLGLAGREIPLGARVLAAADAYVKMTADLPWRAAKSHDEAVEELRAAAGVHLDEEVVHHLLAVLRARPQGGGHGA
ncbi:MAG: HD domain-containing phosphohydrolase [Armatimonadota bacterium]|nr:HD domain-containing phosphohydrolase [Armatimonadota bacterium]